MESGEVTLADLWQVGKPHTFEAPEGVVTVWLQKLTPAEQDDCYKRGRARRAVVMAGGRDKTSDVYVTALQDAYETGDSKAMIGYLTADAANRRLEQVRAEAAAVDEWSKDGYLEGLRQQWDAELAERFLSDPTDPEAARVFEELSRFNQQIAGRLDDVKAELARDWEGYSEEQLRDETTTRLIADAATEAFLSEYHRCEMWKGTRRDADHSLHYFESRAAVDVLSGEAFMQLRAAFLDLNRTVMAGKDSPASPASSASSEPSDEAETPASSGLVAVSQ
jgi:chemotaxis regulatin CheY-phosphate phosphatase CheZ